jgi:hypothetical protein
MAILSGVLQVELIRGLYMSVQNFQTFTFSAIILSQS